MSSTLDIIQQLISLLKAYEKEEKKITLNGFVSFLARNQKPTPQSSKVSSATSLMESYGNTGASIAFHLTRLNKYAKYYVKEVFDGFALINGDDFGFLAALIEHESMSKTDLIVYNVHEVPSGMEVIKRLLKKGLIKEDISSKDRRIRLLSATDLGKNTFFQATQRMQQVAKIIPGDLNDQEQESLLELIKRLDCYHEDIYKSQKEKSLKSILSSSSSKTNELN
ncbi:MAG: hypothetical protein WEC59_04780 [Salibacteraceae bacterium]